jgi:Xaa-Pro aminopeptidase
MKSDLDSLMQKYQLDALYVYGDETPNMIRTYLLGTDANAVIFKKRGQPPIVIASPMEQEIAARSGFQTLTPYDLGEAERKAQYPNDIPGQAAARQRAYFERLEITGRVAVFGAADASTLVWLTHEIIPTIPSVELVTDFGSRRLFDEAVATKDADELQKLKEVGVLASQVLSETWAFIATHRATAEGTVVDDSGTPLTVGAVKRFVRMRNFELGLENSAGMIFAPGREGATGHGEGDDAHILQTGDCIVFDYFPRSIHSLYYHDLTRTWSLGYARPEVQKVYEQVLNAVNLSVDSFKVGDSGTRYQERVNAYFESQGHPTTRSTPGTKDGYFHSLGHGIGLEVHEAPYFRNEEYGPPLQPGSVFTVEPGLYYPDQNFGVRIEDTVYLDHNGVLHNLTDFHYELVLPLKES